MVNILEIDSVQLGFGTNKLLLSDVFLRCQSGKITALFGRNGSGKSTLLKLIFGTLKAEKSVRLNGELLDPAYTSGLVGFLPQSGFLPRSLRVKEIIRLFIPDKFEQEKLFADARIQQLLKQKIEELSGGQLKYLEVKLLLGLPVLFLLLDEPFLGIEPLYKEILQQELKQASQTRGILITDHDYRSVLEIADTIYLLQNGALKLIKDLEELAEFGYLPVGKLN